MENDLLNKKYQSWQDKLLDLGKRNKLLYYYKKSSRSALTITEPEFDLLYEKFVKNENTLIFERDEQNESNNSVSRGNVKTNISVAETNRVLRTLRQKSKIAMEEQGVNILYLSFGFLHWTESENSNIQITSPLILVPVVITLDSISSPFCMKLHEDEIVTNPTLLFKLENDYNIKLPLFEEVDEIESYFSKINKKIKGKKGWSVSKEVSLGILSFLKINMYEDLKRNKEKILKNPIVMAIGGDGSKLNSNVKDIEDLDNYDFDNKESPKDVFQVLDADSSQQEAILLAKKGVSFVLQGPPGTGKSQTITNIIAESLASGKKVLFVSEKMAALDVVYRRLADAGLEDFCLVLHSHKAKRKDLVNQLQSTLEIDKKKYSFNDIGLRKLKKLSVDRQALNKYASQIYETVKPINKSIFEVYGILSHLTDCPNFPFSFENIRKIDEDHYNTIIELLEQLAIVLPNNKDNSWYDCKTPVLTNEFKNDFKAKADNFLKNIRKFEYDITECFSELKINPFHSIVNINLIIDVLKSAENAHKIPSDWILDKDLSSIPDAISFYSEQQSIINSLLNDLSIKYNDLNSTEFDINLSTIEALTNISAVIKEKNKLETFTSKEEPYCNFKDNNYEIAQNWIVEGSENASIMKALKDEILSEYEDSVFDVDYEGMLIRIKTEYTSKIKRSPLNKDYKTDLKTLQIHKKEIGAKISYDDLVKTIENLKRYYDVKHWYDNNTNIWRSFFGQSDFSESTDYNAFKKKIEIYKILQQSIDIINELIKVFNNTESIEPNQISCYNEIYCGLFSDWAEIEESYNWALEFRSVISKVNVTEPFIKSVCQKNEFVDSCRKARIQIEKMNQAIMPDFEWIISLFSNPDYFKTISLVDLYKRIRSCSEDFYPLQNWIDYRELKEKLQKEGLKSFIKYVENNHVHTDVIIDSFKKRFFNLWLDAILPEYPEVKDFRRKNQEKTISDFSNLDKEQFEIAKARIKSQLINSLPVFDRYTNGKDEISILKSELRKQRKFLPIRQLFKQIPELIMILKPCMLMSPLSVSTFLESEKFEFDIVVFDEASQIRTETAIGALSRAKQAVIAGDRHQLPPSNFFEAKMYESDYDVQNDEDEFDDIGAYESLLDEANLLKETSLKWHYRSRNEKLIAFSNSKIYENKLITFPSNIENLPDNGVEYVFVPNGVYESAGRKGNYIEAEKVAELVFEHFKKYPYRSLGVITFGILQEQAIEAAIRKHRMENQSFEDFFNEEKDEPFFIKSLENVQGDERDTIIFSIGYAKSPTGVFRNAFGPLSNQGGERRLNVAITRAKYDIKLVGSIQPQDINIDKINYYGPKMLRSYIDYAKYGVKALYQETNASNEIVFDSPFEEAVYDFIVKSGYSVDTQVGCSGYKIDLAIKHPTLSGVYVLGIECDGASYHSARTARERDRLRQDVLEKMGWKLYRIWSTDWLNNNKAECENLKKAIENAIKRYSSNQKKTSIESKTNKVEYIEFSEDSEATNIYDFLEVKEIDLSRIPKDMFDQYDEKEIVFKIIENNFPVHFDVACKCFGQLFGKNPSSNYVITSVKPSLNKLLKEKRIVEKDGFYYPSKFKIVLPRVRNDRSIDQISSDELSAAMYEILLNCPGGADKQFVLNETARAYDFNRQGPKIISATSKAFDYFLASGKGYESNGKYFAKSK